MDNNTNQDVTSSEGDNFAPTTQNFDYSQSIGNSQELNNKPIDYSQAVPEKNDKSDEQETGKNQGDDAPIQQSSDNDNADDNANGENNSGKRIDDTNKATEEKLAELEELKKSQAQYTKASQELAVFKKEQQEQNEQRIKQEDSDIESLQAVLERKPQEEPSEDDYYGYSEILEANQKLALEQAQAQAKIYEIQANRSQRQLDSIQKTKESNSKVDDDAKFSESEKVMRLQMGDEEYYKFTAQYQDYLSSVEAVEPGGGAKTHQLVYASDDPAKMAFDMVQVHQDRVKARESSQKDAEKIKNANRQNVQKPSPGGEGYKVQTSEFNLNRALGWRNKNTFGAINWSS